MSRELEIIGLIGRLSGRPEYLTDDAFYEAASRRIYTTDILVEDRHFRRDYYAAADLGWKAAAVNISDIAAMGGMLKYLLVSLALPDTVEMDWVSEFYAGMLALCSRFGGEIAGGDTVGSDRLAVNVTAIGECPEGHQAGFRTAACPGDYLIATGFHGLSAIGMQVLQANQSGYEICKQAHLRPVPQIEAGLLLSSRLERYALMDSSDGLADALLKIAHASGVKLIAEKALIPVHPELASLPEAERWQAILYGGEDFELVAAVPEVDAELLSRFTVIGRVEAVKGLPGAYLQSMQPGDDPMIPLDMKRTYQHFGAQL